MKNVIGSKHSFGGMYEIDTVSAPISPDTRGEAKATKIKRETVLKRLVSLSNKVAKNKLDDAFDLLPHPPISHEDTFIKKELLGKSLTAILCSVGVIEPIHKYNVEEGYRLTKICKSKKKGNKNSVLLSIRKLALSRSKDRFLELANIAAIQDAFAEKGIAIDENSLIIGALMVLAKTGLITQKQFWSPNILRGDMFEKEKK